MTDPTTPDAPEATAATPAEAPPKKAGFWKWITSNRRWAIALIPIALMLGVAMGGGGNRTAAADPAEQDALSSELEEANAEIADLEAQLESLAELEAELAEREAAVAEREGAADEADAAAEANTFGDGTYLVGTDIQAGTYRTNAEGNCYYERLSGLGGTLDDIITNDLPSGPTIIEIAASDVAFSTDGCGTWEKIS